MFKPFFFALVIAVTVWMVSPPHARAETRTVRVGTYQNAPLVFRNATGEVQGLSIDVMEYIAAEEDWKLAYVHGTWPECIARLERGETDIQVVIAYSAERARKYDFATEALFNNWGVVFSRPDTDIESVLDLHGKTVALLEKSIHTTAFKKLISSFDITVKITETGDYASVFELLDRSEVDAGVVNRTFAEMHKNNYTVKRTSIIFNPIEIRYASLKGKNQEVLSAIDRHVRKLKQDGESVYYQSLARWFGAQEKPALPAWLKWSVLAGFGSLAFFISATVLFRYEVKKKTADILRTEKRYQNLFQNANDAIYLADPESRQILDCNEKAAEMTGYTVEELKKMRAEDLHAEDEIPLLPEKFREVSVKGFASGVTGLHHKRKDGVSVPVEISAKIIDVGGKKLNLSIIRDVTERKHFEEKERMLLRQLKTIYDSLPVGIAYMNRELTFISVNKFFLELTGFTEEELIGRPCYETVGEYANDPARKGREKLCSFCRHQDCHKTRKPVITERPLGDYVINVITAPEFDESGDIIRYLEVVENITDRKALEEQLLQAQKMEAVGQLAGGIAHDFNNILTAIVGYGNIMQMKMDQNDPLRENLDHILTSAERASNLTHSLLAFSRKQIIKTNPMELNTVIRDVSTLLRRVIGEDISLKADLIDAHLTILADRGQIEQVLMNLATNARDAMPDGGILMIETEPTELDEEYQRTHGYGEPGRYAMVSITDTGVGMDEQVRKKIFEPFFSTKESGRGTGLGLAMVYGIVKQHSGYINVYSEPGKGTTFKLYFPATAAVAALDTASENVALKGGSETILVAEDDISIRSLAKTVLENAGYSVIEAVDGDDAISKFAGNADRVDLLLLDVIMPKRNGKDVFEEIKKTRSDVKALFTSGYSANLIHEKGILKEGIHFVYKPISPNHLLRKVREVLDL